MGRLAPVFRDNGCGFPPWNAGSIRDATPGRNCERDEQQKG